MPKKPLSKKQASMRINELKVFKAHVIEGKLLKDCSAELGLHQKVVQRAVHSENYRAIAIAYLEDTALGGATGTISKLVDSLDATRPLVIEDVDKNGASTHKITYVTDQNTRMKALQELIKIYGFYAPQQKDVKIAVSISSDADLFAEIDKVERASRYVDSYEQGEGGFELATNPTRASAGNFKSRKRALLQHASVQEPE